MSRTTLALVAACLVTVLVPSAASAEVWRGHDPAGDVVGFESSRDPEPCGTTGPETSYERPEIDLTRVDVRHDHEHVRVVLGLADVRRRRQASFQIDIRTPGRTYSASVWNARWDGRWQLDAGLSRVPEPPAEIELDECGSYSWFSGELRCDLTVDMDAHAEEIAVEVPRRCLRTPRWVQVAPSSYSWIEHDERRSRSMYDEWRARTEGSWDPAYSPRIRPHQGRVR